MPFKNKEYERDLREDKAKGALSKAYSRLFRTMLLNDEKIKSENCIRSSFEFDARFSETGVNQRPITNKIVPTVNFRKALI